MSHSAPRIPVLVQQALVQAWLPCLLMAPAAAWCTEAPPIQATPGTSTQTADPARDARDARDIRYVVFHTPGPAWVAGRSPMQQPGIREHIAHYIQWLGAGKLLLGGPHLDAQGGGMMIPKAGISEAEIRRFAEADPAVQAGLLRVSIRPWMIGMGH